LGLRNGHAAVNHTTVFEFYCSNAEDSLHSLFLHRCHIILLSSCTDARVCGIRLTTGMHSWSAYMQAQACACSISDTGLRSQHPWHRHVLAAFLTQTCARRRCTITGMCLQLFSFLEGQPHTPAAVPAADAPLLDVAHCTLSSVSSKHFDRPEIDLAHPHPKPSPEFKLLLLKPGSAHMRVRTLSHLRPYTHSHTHTTHKHTFTHKNFCWSQALPVT